MPQVGWCTWPGAPASRHQDSAFSERSSPTLPAAGPWKRCDCGVVCDVEIRSEPQVWYLEMYSRWKTKDTAYLIQCTITIIWIVKWRERENALTSQSLRERERVNGRPIVRRVLRLLRRLLMQVVHSAQWVHGVERVSVHSVVLHDSKISAKIKWAIMTTTLRFFYFSIFYNHKS